ncbi:MAG: hypothetical protein K6U87_04870 [Firmicutes bacterium]|nr:hypothetical protein [Bacillota bacterium]
MYEHDHSEHKAKEYHDKGVVPFWPEHLLKEMVVGLTAVAALFVFSIFVHPTLGHIADPADWAYVPAPDWYFYWVQNFFDVSGFYWSELGLTKFDWILMFLIPVILILALYTAPFWDRARERRLLKRPVAFGMMLFGLTFLGYFTANGIYNHDYLVSQEPINIFRTSCANCHSIQGLGGNNKGVVETAPGQFVYPPDLTHTGSILSPAQIEQQLVNPVGGMPNLHLPPAAVSYMVDYLSSLK